MYNIDKNIKASAYQKNILKKSQICSGRSTGTYNCTDKNSCVIFKRSLKNEDDPVCIPERIIVRIKIEINHLKNSILTYVTVIDNVINTLLKNKN